MKPIYSSQVEGAANNINAAYAAQAPKIQGYADQVGSLLPGMIDRAQNGGTATQAANDYLQRITDGGTVKFQRDPYLDSLQGAKSYHKDAGSVGSTYQASDYFQNIMGGGDRDNPYLDQMIGQANTDLMQTMQANLGTRGLTGSTHLQDIVSKNLGEQSLGLRYNDYQYQTGRMDDAAGIETGRMDSAAEAAAGRQQTTNLANQQARAQAEEATRARAAAAAEAEAARAQQQAQFAAQQELAAQQLALQAQAQESANVGNILGVAQAAGGMPLDAAIRSNTAAGAILSPYSSTTQTQSGDLFSSVIGLGGTLGGAYLGGL